MNRRDCLRLGAGLWTGMASCTVPAAPPAGARARLAAEMSAEAPAEPLPSLRLVVPAGEGGGWDQTARALGGAALAVGLVRRVDYEYHGGRGGTLGLADFVARYSRDPQALLMGGMVMLGALAVHRPTVTLADVWPLARLTSDSLVLAVPAASPWRDWSALASQWRCDTASVVVTGGSLGGVDHLLAGMLVRQLRADPARLRYRATDSGRDALAVLLSGGAQLAISSYSEFRAELERGRLRALAVSSRRGQFGIPSLTEQGVPTELANWRGVFAPRQLAPAQQQALRRLVLQATATPVWQASLAENGWVDAWLEGRAFAEALEVERGIASSVALMLKLKG